MVADKVEYAATEPDSQSPASPDSPSQVRRRPQSFFSVICAVPILVSASTADRLKLLRRWCSQTNSERRSRRTGGRLRRAARRNKLSPLACAPSNAHPPPSLRCRDHVSGVDCSSPQAPAPLPACKYGANCYRTSNEVRQRQPAHARPSRADCNGTPTSARPSPFGTGLESRASPALLLSQEHLAEYSHPAKEELTDEQLARMEASRKRAVQQRALSRRLL